MMIYTQNDVMSILHKKRYSHTLIYKQLLKSVNIRYQDIRRGADISELRRRAEERQITLLNDEREMKEFVQRVNKKIIGKMLTSYISLDTETRILIRSALLRVNRRDRFILMRYFLYGDSIGEISFDTGLSESIVRKQIEEAMNKIIYLSRVNKDEDEEREKESLFKTTNNINETVETLINNNPYDYDMLVDLYILQAERRMGNHKEQMRRYAYETEYVKKNGNKHSQADIVHKMIQQNVA